MATDVRPHSAITLWTLGQPRVCGDSAVRLCGRRKALVLVAYLARQSPRAIPRERLSRLLWGDRDDSRARQSLRQALLELRRAIGDGLEVQADRVTLHANAVELDATTFECETAAGQFEAAVARWHGDFLETMDDVGAEPFRIWLESERERLRRQLVVALTRLTADALKRGDWRAVERWASRWGQGFPLDERGHLPWMHALRMTGRITEAVSLHAAFVARWRAELNEEPSAALEQLGRQLEDDAAHRPRGRGPGAVAVFAPDLVERDAALAELHAAWDDVREGHPAIVLIEGDRGIGKTRLCQEFLRAATSRGDRMVVLRARSGGETDPAMTLEPFGIARELLQDLREARGLAGAAPRALAELARVAPWVRHDFSNLPDARGTDRALVDGVSDALAAVAEERPIVVVLDDVSDADAATQALLAGLAHVVPRRVMLLLITRCDEPRHRPLAQGLAAARVQRLKLQPLSLGGVDAMLASMLGMRDHERHALAVRLLSDTGGNPFYVAELVSTLADQGWLMPTGMGDWKAGDVHPDWELPIPSGVRAAILGRLAKLDAATRRIVDIASMVDSPFTPGRLLEISELSPAALTRSLDDLIDRRLFRHAPTRPGGLEFAQPLLRRAAAQSLDPGDDGHPSCVCSGPGYVPSRTSAPNFPIASFVAFPSSA
ncbi:MAG: ATP-binding protein [Gemmatimonadaceae bacterium]